MPAHYWIETGNYAAAMRPANARLAAERTRSDDAGRTRESYEKHDVAVGYSAAMMLGQLRRCAAMGCADDVSVRNGFRRDYGVALRALRSAYAAPAIIAGVAVRGLADLPLKPARHVSEAPETRRNARSRLRARVYAADICSRARRNRREYTPSRRAGLRGPRESTGSLLRRIDSALPLTKSAWSSALTTRRIAGAIAAFTEALDTYPTIRARFSA